ncbi:BON domain-containing protein [Acidicapsa dinghuensis]|uniref:BON domain-containing protein n=1 Tax=Acidicapsa dinghuensis TaxID=2218256 RepID=A0ABW1EFL5_9BACT|nr:BON domain-containing protein [Acidicapsa dinghuensis]
MIPTRFSSKATLAGIVVGALLSLPLASFALSGNRAASTMEDESPAAAVTAKLNKKQFQNVKVTVDNGVATLSGTVDLYEYKEQADKIAHKVKGVSAVRNEIQVAGASVSDQELQQKLVEKLQYDRVGYGNAFNAISVQVHDGAVTLGGHAHTPVDRDSALALVSTYPGVKDVNDEVQVDPVSIMDERTRVAVAHAIYSFPSLNKYAINPAAPIRVSVQNGNVELYGVVDTQADKDTAYLRANAVPGVFSVKNYLQVANQTPEKK